MHITQHPFLITFEINQVHLLYMTMYLLMQQNLHKNTVENSTDEIGDMLLCILVEWKGLPAWPSPQRSCTPISVLF